MKKNATVSLCRQYTVGEIDKNLFGSFVEHLGRAVYGGIFEPTHPLADKDGFRKDVLDLVKEMGVSIVRYPGGNFVSGYNWEDGVGLVKDRPKRLELAWNSLETNEFGTNEFVTWCKKAGAEPLMAVNLGTRGADEARHLVEYCNHPSGTYYSDLRIAHGYKKPHNIKYWCLGNEMDGPWQMGFKTAEDYGKLASQTAQMMKTVDPSVKLVLCGSSNSYMKTFGDWEYTVLNHAYDHVDYISLHQYFGDPKGNTPDFLSKSLELDNYINTVIAYCDAVKGKKHAKRTVNLSVDEWNVWYHSNGAQFEKWSKAPHLLEDVYNFEDALLVGSLLLSLLRRADRVKIGCIAQLVNVIAPMMTENSGDAWRQTTFFPFAHVAAFGKGKVLTPLVTSTKHDTKSFTDVPDVDTLATFDEANGKITVFAVNRDMESSLPLTVNFLDFDNCEGIEHIEFAGFDRYEANTALCRNVKPKHKKLASPKDGSLTLKLKPLSWNVFRFKSKY